LGNCALRPNPINEVVFGGCSVRKVLVSCGCL